MEQLVKRCEMGMQAEYQAYAKVNIGLDVVRRLENGYHEVRMIMQTLSLHDTLFMERCEEKGIFLETDSRQLQDTENNLIYRACKLMFDKYQLPGGIRVRLIKRIPIAAGMAGGSADAAAAFRGINDLYGLQLRKEQLMEHGVTLGADIPYCMVGGTYISEGIGEVLTPAPAMPNCYILIAKPPVGVSTKWVYENLHAERLTKHPDIDEMLEAMRKGSLKELAATMANVLEMVTAERYPIIRQLAQQMERAGAVKAMMSGSGPTVFGLFETKEACHSACQQLQEEGELEAVFECQLQEAYG